MRIEYQQFADSALIFSPSREEREMMLDVFKFLYSRSTDSMNRSVVTYFIERIEAELSSNTH